MTETKSKQLNNNNNKNPNSLIHVTNHEKYKFPEKKEKKNKWIYFQRNSPVTTDLLQRQCYSWRISLIFLFLFLLFPRSFFYIVFFYLFSNHLTLLLNKNSNRKNKYWNCIWKWHMVGKQTDAKLFNMKHFLILKMWIIIHANWITCAYFARIYDERKKKGETRRATI